MADGKNRLEPLDRSRTVMAWLWGLFVLGGVALCILLLWKVITYKEDEKFGRYLVPQNRYRSITPVRGDILDCRNRIMATSTLAYEVRFDCTVAKDTLWENNVGKLAQCLAKEIGSRTAGEYETLLRRGRRVGSRYMLIGKDLTQLQINRIRKMPIFSSGRFHGGYLEERSQKRLYPYGSSARRTIGYVRDNADSTNNRMIGLEGNFDSYLHGKDGKQLMRRSDFGMIPVTDKENKKAVNGMDVRTTIDVDIQNIADEALRKAVGRSELIEKACVIVMETRTGAIKAMVNLGRDRQGNIGEWDNYAVRTAEAPGSIFKGAVVMALLEDGYITSLDQEIPTFGGLWKYNGIMYNDTKHVGKQRFPSGKVKLREAFEMSANNPFRQLICDPKHYGSNPARFIQRIKGFGLMDTLSFDLKGCTPPFILDPSMKRRTPKGFWDGGTFPRLAIGYGMELSPLNLVTFYNAIANDGVMMQPYLVEAIQENGHELESFKPRILHEHICSKSTADTLKKVMSMVASDKGGTAYWQLHGAVCPIAGKTGTAQRVFRMSNGRYGYNDHGVESQQGSFVGFFPVDKPEYTAIVVIWSKPSISNFFGASYAAPPFREIADKIYCLNDD
ncbi:MAG: penicillin-binding protein 2 [Bacteroidales bacterium]|nr:penicillin-binding protein 2 [Candidatus Hennigimonas equi]